MELFSTIKSFLFITLCLVLIADTSQAAPVKENYMILRPGDVRRLSHILKGAGDFQIDPKPWNKRENYDEKTTTTRPTLGEYDIKIKVFPNKLNLTEIAPSKTDEEQVREDFRQKLENLFPSSTDDAAVYYFN